MNEKDRTIELKKETILRKVENEMNYVATEKAPQAIGPYAQAVSVNGMIYTSGQIPLTPEGLLVEGTIEEQTHQVFANLKSSTWKKQVLLWIKWSKRQFY